MSENNVPQPAQKSSAKFILMFVGLGILVSIALVSFYMPRMILWYFEPPMPMGVSCTGSIRWAVDRLLIAQLYSIAVGAVIGLLVGLKLKKKRKSAA